MPRYLIQLCIVCHFLEYVDYFIERMAFSFSAIIKRTICFSVIATLQKNDNDKKKTTAGSSLAVVFVPILKII